MPKSWGMAGSSHWRQQASVNRTGMRKYQTGDRGAALTLLPDDRPLITPRLANV